MPGLFKLRFQNDLAAQRAYQIQRVVFLQLVRYGSFAERKRYTNLRLPFAVRDQRVQCIG